jgi:hypothetical protein
MKSSGRELKIKAIFIGTIEGMEQPMSKSLVPKPWRNIDKDSSNVTVIAVY